MSLSPIDATESEIEVQDIDLMHVPFPTANNQKYIANIDALFANCQSLIETYNVLAEARVAESRIEGLEAQLERDKVFVTGAIDAARRVTKMKVKEALSDDLHEVRGRAGMTGEDEALGKMVLGKVKSGGMVEGNGIGSGVGFGKMACQFERVLGRLEDVGVRKERDRRS
jgi:hypothetical protein